MKRRNLEGMSASDQQLLRDVPGMDWEKFPLSRAARLANATREWQAAAPCNEGRFPKQHR